MRHLITKTWARLRGANQEENKSNEKSDPIDREVERGLTHLQEGHQEAAGACFEKILEAHPENFRALHYMGILAAQSGDFKKASELLRKAEQISPPDAELTSNLGNALRYQGCFDEALEAYQRAQLIDTSFANAYLNRASLLLETGDSKSALDNLDTFLALVPDNWRALNARGDALTRLGRHDEALASFDKALVLASDSVDLLINRGSALTALRRFPEAITAFREATRRDPENFIAHFNLGTVLHQGRISTDEALECFDKAIQINPEHGASFHNRANVLDELGRFTEAIDNFKKALLFDSTEDSTFGMMMYTKMRICDWEGFSEDCENIVGKINQGIRAAVPFMMLAVTGELPLQRKIADISASYLKEKFPPLPLQEKYGRHDRIRIAYFSADLRNHPVAFLTAELFELHDAEKFEVVVFSFGPYDEMTRRVNSAVEDYIDARTLTDEDVVNLARTLEIDIAIDLGGYTAHNRSSIFSMRVAPIQVSYLGYPGTMGGSIHDYLIADRILIPKEHENWYSEKIIHLPVYQINDSKREISSHVFSRAELGLPENSFVFCCFNNTVKFNPRTFDIWMRILLSVPNSVLFLLAGSDEATRNLRQEAEKRGVSQERIVLGGRLPRPEYLARYRSCDLFLDTQPFNAGTTASDALWAGLPVLTCAGDAFAGRMATSLLTALKLPELIAKTDQDYEQLAIKLATSPEELRSLREKLAHNIRNELLFDTETVTRHIEKAYTTIYEHHQNGLSPETLEILH